MSSLQELLDQKAALEKQIEATRREAKADAIARVKALMSEFGLTAADLSGHSPGKGGSAAKGSKVAAKYRNKATGESWSGRGLQPKWLKAALASGRKLEDFAV
ncbi:MAG: H-NS family nucleoid-associated regulatory protein [Burkholderiales bacterium]